MKQLKRKKGFTLVECVVAMAVLAIMSLLLTMILSVALYRKNANMRNEREIDEQIASIAKGDGASEQKDIGEGIKLYANGAELGDKIPGKDEGVKAENVKHEGDNVQLESFKFDFEDYKKFDDISNGKFEGGGALPEEGYEKSKCFGALLIKDGDVTITEASRVTKTEKVTVEVKEEDEDGNEKVVKKEVEKTYYIVKWQISFEALEKSNEKSVKVRIPKSGKIISGKNIMGGAVVDALSDTAVRIEPQGTGYSNNEIEFKIYDEDMKDYENVVKFFTGIGSGNTTTIKLQY